MRVHRVILSVMVCLALFGQSAAACCVTLRWTAPGDDGMSGRAHAYQILYSTSPITAENWQQSAVATWTPIPSIAGTKQEAVVSGLEVGRRYYFVVRTCDDLGNWSELSNVVSAVVPAPVCDGFTGNVNCDPQNIVNLSDLTALVDHLFITFRPLACPGEANTSGDAEGRITLIDLTRLVDFMYRSGQPLAPCL